LFDKLSQLWRRLLFYLRRDQFGRELEEEMRFHLEMRAQENTEAGMKSEEARYAAKRQFGNRTLLQEVSRDMWAVRSIETLFQDVRYGVRMLLMNKSFAAVAVLSLALGIGANTAIFQLLDAVRLRTLPVNEPQQLARVRVKDLHWWNGSWNGRYGSLSYPVWEQIQKRQEGFSSIFAFGTASFDLSQRGEQRVTEDGLFVSGDFFNTLRVPALLGRVFTAADDQRGCTMPGAVISHSFWQREFGGAPSAIGRKLTLDGQPFEIVGVTPANFRGVEIGRSYDVAVPICAEPLLRREFSSLDKPQNVWLAVMGRLKPGWTLEKASAQLATVSPGIFEVTLPTIYDANGAKHYLPMKLEAIEAAAGFSQLRRSYETPLIMLLAIAAAVLLIACANLASLMLARASAREREIAVRLAIGASRGRLLRQLLAESLLLALMGAAVGMLLARLLADVLVTFLSTDSNRIFLDLNPDWRVFAFTTGLAMLTCVLFGLAPALRASSTPPVSAMKAGGRQVTPGSRGRFGLRRVLVVMQVALSLVLLTAALLFVRSFRNLATVEAGFQQDGILQVDLDLTRLKLPKDRRLPYRRELLERLRAVPGVESAASTGVVPVSGSRWNEIVVMNGGGPKREQMSWFNRVSPSYFKTLGIPLIAGRDFGDSETPTSPKVAVVNREFSRLMALGENPIGQSFRIRVNQGEQEQTYQIVGLTGDTKYSDLHEESAMPVVYVPAAHDDRPDEYDTIFLRSGLPLGSLVAGMRHTLTEVNPEIGFRFRVFKNEIRDTLGRERLMATLSAFFGFLAAVLSTVGLYGVIAFMVARRTNEIGIRMALGATPQNVLAMVLREATAMLAIGMAAGALVAVGVGKTVDSLLFGLEPSDPRTLLGAIALLGLVALAASYLPAQRAASLEPMLALRDE
jgi:putative ABC transport system permease protein